MGSVILPLSLFALCLAAFLLMSVLRPDRLSNSLLLLLSLLAALWCIAAFFGDGSGRIYAVFAVLLLALLLLVPILLIWNGLVMRKRESGRLSNLLSLLFGVFLAAGEIASAAFLLRGFSFAFPDLLILLFGASVFYFSALLLSFVLYSLLLPLLSHGGSFDTVLVHGCALIHGNRVSRILANRLDLALSIYHRSGDKARLVVSGGRGDDETVTEAEAMRDYLLAKGVPEEKIYLEKESHSTKENLVNSLELFSSPNELGTLALVTSNYHVFRCALIARALDLRCKAFGAPVAAYYWPSAVIREFAAVYSRKPYRVYALLGYCLFVVLPIIVVLI